MTINQTRYVDITSGVGAGAVVAQRELVGRLFTTNALIAPQTVVTFDNADAVAARFGANSEEYARALFYFSWISKNLTRAQRIQFARWSQAAVAPYIFGVVQAQAMAGWTPITSGAFAIVINGAVIQISGLNFSTAVTLTDVASIVQTALRATANPQLATCLVTWDVSRGSFNFTGTIAETATLAIEEPIAGTSIVARLGWGAGAIVANGSDAESVTETMIASTNISDNFGSFLFMPALAVDEIQALARWNKTQNVKFLYTVAVSSANVATYYNALQSTGGVALTLSNIAGEYPEMAPMIIEAATDYTLPNAGQNYMFQQFPGLSASVTSDAEADAMDASRINYYGRTQSAGQLIDFYQRGYMMGLATDPLDMNTYVNEIWLKAAATAAILTLLLAVNEVSANERGRTQLLAIIQDVIDQALVNAVISVGKTLTPAQRVIVTEISGDDKAWYQVTAIGYWINCVIRPVVISGVTNFEAHYVLIYSKDDVIRKVTGQHVLI